MFLVYRSLSHFMIQSYDRRQFKQPVRGMSFA